MNRIKIIYSLMIFLFTSANVSSQSLSEIYENGRKAFYSDRFDEANEYFTQILSLGSDNFDNCFYKGLVYEINFDNDKAISELTAAIGFDPVSSEAYYRRGSIFEKQEKFDKAIDDYTFAIKFDKKNSEAYFKRASAYQEKKLYNEAIEDFTKVIKLNPEDDIAVYNRGLIYMELKQNEKAIADFEKTISIDKSWEKSLRPVIEKLLSGQ